MGQRKGPQAKVRGRVRNAAETELDCVDDLVNDHFTKVVVLLFRDT